MSATATKWPLDFDELAKGDRIEPERIESVFGIKRTDEKYRLTVLKLRERIADEMLQRGLVVTVKTEGDGGLRILEDEEASTHNPRIYDQGMRLMKHAYRRNMGVDQNRLTEGRLREHERTLVVQGKVLQAAEGAKKETLRLLAVERKTPGKLSG